jgi:cytochrome b561
MPGKRDGQSSQKLSVVAPHVRAVYSLLQIVLHWTIAVLVAIQFLFHDEMEKAFDDLVAGDHIRGDELAGAWLHACIGLTILALAIIRLSVRLQHGAPPAHHDKSRLLIWIASATHIALYGFIIAMPIVVGIAWFGLSETAGDIHSTAAPLLLTLIGLHVAGAFTEHFVFRNDTLKRMLIPERAQRQAPDAYDTHRKANGPSEASRHSR